jgi:hypothetical protein
MAAKKKVVKKAKGKTTPKATKQPLKTTYDSTARLREIRALVESSNKSTLDTNLIIAQIYMESRFDAKAHPPSGAAKGLMQLQRNGVRQVFKYRKIKDKGGGMTSDKETQAAFKEADAVYNDPKKMFDEAANIQLGTEYMQYWLDNSSSVDDAYKKYRGKSNGVYYKKIKACADKLAANPDSMDPLKEMVSSK